MRIAGRSSMFVALALCWGCDRQTPAPAPKREDVASSRPTAVEPKAAEATATTRVDSRAQPARPGRLPEDHAAGLRAQQQWREHLAHEEEERQMIFDRPRLEQHRAVVRLIDAARARYDRARSEAGVSRVRAGMPDRLSKIRARIAAIDKWGNNSPLLPDYAALLELLADGYAEARIGAIAGRGDTLAQARADYDRRMSKIDHWLEEVEHGEDEDDEGGGDGVTASRRREVLR